jgi:hypothetical protein
VCGSHEERIFFVTAQSALFHVVEIADGITLRTAVSGFRLHSQQGERSGNSQCLLSGSESGGSPSSST